MTTIMSSSSSNRSSKQRRRRNSCQTSQLLMCGLTGIVCFYAGLLVGSTSSSSSNVEHPQPDIEKRVKAELTRLTAEYRNQQQKNNNDNTSRFAESMKHVLVGAATVPRDDFFEEFSHQLGVPVDESDRNNNNQVLILYQSEKALPDNPFVATEATSSQTPIPAITSVSEAVQNCDYLNVVLTDHSHGRRKQCLAVVGQYEAFHIQKFMRLPKSGKLDSTLPLRLVNRGAAANGRASAATPPSLEQTATYWKILQTYLQSFDAMLTKLRPIVESVVADTNNNTVVVLVCNFGQSELLLNFVCHARQQGLDLSKQILVFATDTETADLAETMGLAVFYDEINFAGLPKNAAQRYADKTFMKMMMAKVFCVQAVSWLGYNVLFQDVDVIWYRNPVPYFVVDDTANDATSNTNDNDDFDIYFQDDGNHALYYAPYSANTGFYFVRSNDKTRHFFNSFLMAGDLILSTHSHQVPLIALLQEHASLYGLKVKIFNARTTNDFPGGHAFHRRKDFMKDVLAGRETPYIFHMSWTHNKANKIKYYQQMGEWYLRDTCIQRTVSDILDGEAPAADNNQAVAAALVPTCCAAEAIFSCHYRDKPSKKPCKDSPPIDEGRPSWW